MTEAPKRNWEWYEAKCRQEHVKWLRGLSPADSVALCEELRRLAARSQGGAAASDMLDQKRWEEKLARRKSTVAAFQACDRIGRK